MLLIYAIFTLQFEHKYEINERYAIKYFWQLGQYLVCVKFKLIKYFSLCSIVNWNAAKREE